MCEFAEYQMSKDQYIGTPAISKSLFCALLQVACGGALFDCTASKVGAVTGVVLGEGKRQQQ